MYLLQKLEVDVLRNARKELKKTEGVFLKSETFSMGGRRQPIREKLYPIREKLYPIREKLYQ